MWARKLGIGGRAGGGENGGDGEMGRGGGEGEMGVGHTEIYRYIMEEHRGLFTPRQMAGFFFLPLFHFFFPFFPIYTSPAPPVSSFFLFRPISPFPHLFSSSSLPHLPSPFLGSAPPPLFASQKPNWEENCSKGDMSYIDIQL